MNVTKKISILFVIFSFYVSFGFSVRIINHSIKVTVDTETNSISGEDEITVLKSKKDIFLPVGNILQVDYLSVNGDKISIDVVKSGDKRCVKIPHYYLGMEKNKVYVSFDGKFNRVPENPRFSQEFMNIETDGYIVDDFVYLPPEGYWYPHFDSELSTFDLEVSSKSDLVFVTTGSFLGKKVSGIYTTYHFSEDKPVEPIFLIGGRYKVDRDVVSGIKLYTYFFGEDRFLSGRYLSAVKRYIKMYSDLIGKYPFPKFAVVENQLPTGFGMPSYTLLGAEVIRLPFIVYTSLGHEVLHNWWGNSVFVDYYSGNWCEGLTSYMADHYYKELKGGDEAKNYRRQLLVNYMSYVKKKNEIPLSQFVERHNPSDRAIGYGKALMVFHMLRKIVGDKVFYQALKNFYSEMVWKKASWSDIERIFEETWDKIHSDRLKEYEKNNKKIPEFEKNLDTSLDWFFSQWIYRIGAPEIGVKVNMVYQVGEHNYLLSFTLTQSTPTYKLQIPIKILTEKGKDIRKLTFEDKEHEYQVILKDRPIKLIIDPDYDIFRKLYPEEIPPSISTILGRDILYVYFSSNFKDRDKYFEFLKKFFDKKDVVPVKDLSDAMSKVGEGNSVLFFETSQDVMPQELEEISLEDFNLKEGSLFLNSKPYPILGNKKGIVIFKTKGGGESTSAVFIDDGNFPTFKTVFSKIVHYGRYGYLIFEGEKNILKGEWETTNSPLILDLK